MRRPVFQTSAAVAAEIFARAHHVHMASTDAAGAPVHKTVHAVVDGDALLFHAAPVGEKMETVGRDAIATAVEVVAQIPSWFTDPERACPATTLYRSAQARGPVVEVTEPERKARALRLLMRRFQPEGRYVDIAADAPLYQKAIAGLFVGAVSLEGAVGKAKLMQHKKPADREKVLLALFRRGAAGDTAAIEAIREANPADPVPVFLRGPGDTVFCLAPSPNDAAVVARLLAGTYWNDNFDEDDLVRAHLGSNAWIVLRGAGGELVGSARAITDGTKHAWVYDVIVAPHLRGTQAGTTMMRLLLDHPAVRGARYVHLGTRDAQAFYARLGFVETKTITRPYASTPMTLDRGNVTRM